MINRILIRMKTVQLLYSYLLIEKPFMLESSPSNPTKEKRFADDLYLDMIFLIDRLAHDVIGKNKTLPLLKSRFILKIEQDERFKSKQASLDGKRFVFTPAENGLAAAIKESLLFREFEKNGYEDLYQDKFWENVFNSIIMQDPTVISLIRNREGYTLGGEERMKLMMEETFKNFYTTRDNVDDALKTLEFSMQKARDLYMHLMALPVELTALHNEQLENNRKKHLASLADLNPNMRLANNTVAALIAKDPVFEAYIDKNHLSWKDEDPDLLHILLKAILESEIYKEYKKEPLNTIEKDSEFWRHILVDVILNNKDFLEYLENKSVFWNDDLEIMGSFALKSLKRLESGDTVEDAILPMYKDGEDGKDAKFGADLFRYVVKNKDLYRHYINEILEKDKWEADRLAFMDVVITITALAEIINYPEIPLTVSVNEYIEIAKSYSSSKSGQFVNGLLASLIDKLRADGVIRK